MAINNFNEIEKCSDCGSHKDPFEKCQVCELKKRLEGVVCPLCKGDNIVEKNLYKSNGIIGPGHSSYSLLTYLVCKNDGVMFENLKLENKKGQ